MHEDRGCAGRRGASAEKTRDVKEPEPKKESPFAVLEKLKTH
jgi:uncharacterized metal-binding protein YceD (DUF177 family)